MGKPTKQSTLNKYKQMAAKRMRQLQKQEARAAAVESIRRAWELNLAYWKLAHFGLYLMAFVAMFAMVIFLFFVMRLK